MSIKVLGNFENARKELINDKNNAVAYVYDQMKNLNQNGSLSNTVFTIKNVFATDDATTNASSKILENFQPHYNAQVVQKLLNAGAVPVAKVHSDELALGGTGTYSGFGLVRNPIDPERLSGGSSSGSIATLTKNISFALASDTGDSVRLPASYNGKVGFKPSYGAISRYGMFAYCSSLDTVAFFAHNVNDIFEVSKATFGVDNKDMTSVEVKMHQLNMIKPKNVIALDLDEFLENYVLDSYNKLIEKLIKNGVNVKKIKPDLTILRNIKPVYDIVSYSEASANLANLNGIAFGERKTGENWQEIMTNTRTSGFGKMVQRRLTLGSYYLYSKNQDEIFKKAQKVRRVIKDYLTNLHKNSDVLIYPASAAVAPFIDFSKNKNYDLMEYILTGSNLVGNPSITLPLGKKDNLPFNIALDSEIYSDEKLLSISLWFEEILGGK
ncbi:amidase family protein [Mycoplasma anserisalpingitidis]|uniref:amidase family protein n=1 Tax=Mycoplasma anserisalpingitidis TaxID=519450 RepID=UPI001CF69A27|nr:amidase family protein [Mycoplasma anserisalpingitidis]UCU26628.1 Asp-tRNA(Asn)/Glu-tRNA(Gln) amidotransferase GatCAB subunit A [Mycoplasma anserisalpingitidis]UCU27466.1 Asp-tRNA(Asn)/Glu-tRNA(Gln) amidotransferase GatCAB subunit A [Mycoplasma anserisalpingitidis]